MVCTVHGILQARILEWVAFSFSGGFSWPRDWTQVSRIASRFFTSWAAKEALLSLSNLRLRFLHVSSLLDRAFLFYCWIVFHCMNLCLFIHSPFEGLLGCFHLPSILSKESESEVAQSCLTLCDPMDCSLAGSAIHGIFQAGVLEWVAISFSRRSSRPRDWTWVSRIVGICFTVWATREVWWHVMGSIFSYVHLHLWISFGELSGQIFCLMFSSCWVLSPLYLSDISPLSHIFHEWWINCFFKFT